MDQTTELVELITLMVTPSQTKESSDQLNYSYLVHGYIHNIKPCNDHYDKLDSYIIINDYITKIEQIQEAIKNQNISQLKSLGIEHGFINMNLRKQAWSLILLNQDPNTDRQQDNQYNNKYINQSDNEQSIEQKQIEKDIERSVIKYYFPNETERQEKYNGLRAILHNIFSTNNNLHYIQGYNDITSIIYMVCNNESLTTKIANNIATTHMSEYIMGECCEINGFPSSNLTWKLLTSYDNTFNDLFNLIIGNTDRTSTELITLITTSWKLTWFSQDIKNINIITRLYDYFICCDTNNNQLVTAYFSAALIIVLKDNLYNFINKFHQSYIDESTLMDWRYSINWDQININQVIKVSQQLFNNYSDTSITNSNSNSPSRSRSLSFSTLSNSFSSLNFSLNLSLTEEQQNEVKTLKKKLNKFKKGVFTFIRDNMPDG
eukprot:16176_1